MRLMPAKPAGSPAQISCVPLFSLELAPTWASLSYVSQRVLAGMEIGLLPHSPGLPSVAAGGDSRKAAPNEAEGKAAGESLERQDNLSLPSSRAPDVLCHRMKYRWPRST